jgi:hypothetical protein
MPFVGREVITGEKTFVDWLESEKASVVNVDTAGSDSGRDTRQETK